MPGFETPDNTSQKSEAEIKNEKEQRKKKIIALAKELSKSQESLPFSGIDSASYSELKKSCEEFPNYATHPDKLAEGFKEKGIKVVFGRYPESGNVFILPFESNDIDNDGMLPKHLQIDESMDSRLKELILASRS